MHAAPAPTSFKPPATWQAPAPGVPSAAVPRPGTHLAFGSPALGGAVGVPPAGAGIPFPAVRMGSGGLAHTAPTALGSGSSGLGTAALHGSHHGRFGAPSPAAFGQFGVPISSTGASEAPFAFGSSGAGAAQGPLNSLPMPFAPAPDHFSPGRVCHPGDCLRIYRFRQL